MQVFEKFEITKSMLFVFAIGLWLYWLWTRRHFYWFSLKYPGYLGAPIIGVMGRLINSQNFIEFGSTIFEKSKLNSLLIWFGLYPVLLTIDPDLIGATLSMPELLNKAQTIYKPIYKMSSFGGLLASPVDEWQHSRKLINPSFHHKVLKNMFPVFNKNMVWAISKLDTLVDNREHKLEDLLRNISMRTTMETTMGKIMNEGDQVTADITDVYTMSFEKVLHEAVLSFLNLGWVMNLDRKFSKMRSTIHNFVNELILNKIGEEHGTNEINFCLNAKKVILDPDNIHTEDAIQKPNYIFIDQAIKIYRNKQFSWNDIIAESNSIFAASFDTSANLLFSSLVMLAMHSEVQEYLYEEIVNVFPEKHFEVQYEHLEQLPYLNMVISEVLRLIPPVPVIGRHVVKDTQLSKDLILPKNLQILISIFHLHRRTDIWGPNADKFDPNNFLPANLMEKHAYAYIPFSKGKRNCIGWRYANFMTKTILSGLVRNFRFKTSFKYEDLDFSGNITIKYKNEPVFEIIRR